MVAYADTFIQLNERCETMKVVHLNINPEKPASSNDVAPVRHLRKLTKRELFAYEMALKGYKKALKDLAPKIEEIQKEVPGWVPEFRFKSKS